LETDGCGLLRQPREVAAMNVIMFDDYRRKGNGAREALKEIMFSERLVDVFLARLWMLGFKVVPLEEQERG
jgi:hypothetical protein